MARTTKTKTTQRNTRKSAPKASPGGENALELLKADHREVSEWFDQYEDLKEEAEKGELARRICQALLVHAQIEEEIFYPPSREATGDGDLLDEAAVEHAQAKHLIREILAMKPGDDLFDAKVTVLGEEIRHHVEEEEGELFPEISAGPLDLKALGSQLAARKAELMKGGPVRKAS